MENVTIDASAGIKVQGNLYGCNFFLFHNHMEIYVIVKRMVYRDSCTSVVPKIFTHIETISEINMFRI